MVVSNIHEIVIMVNLQFREWFHFNFSPLLVMTAYNDVIPVDRLAAS